MSSETRHRTAAPRPLTVTLLESTARILRTAYRGERPVEVLHRAVLMLATADGHLTPDGQPISERGGR